MLFDAKYDYHLHHLSYLEILLTWISELFKTLFNKTHIQLLYNYKLITT